MRQGRTFYRPSSRGGYHYCHDGAWQTLITGNARGGTAYYMRIYEKGLKHTIDAKAYYKN